MAITAWTSIDQVDVYVCNFFLAFRGGSNPASQFNVMTCQSVLRLFYSHQFPWNRSAGVLVSQFNMMACQSILRLSHSRQFPRNRSAGALVSQFNVLQLSHSHQFPRNRVVQVNHINMVACQSVLRLSYSHQLPRDQSAWCTRVYCLSTYNKDIRCLSMLGVFRGVVVGSSRLQRKSNPFNPFRQMGLSRVVEEDLPHR